MEGRALQEKRYLVRDYDEEVEEQLMAEYEEQERQFGQEWVDHTSADWLEERREELRNLLPLDFNDHTLWRIE